MDHGFIHLKYIDSALFQLEGSLRLALPYNSAKFRDDQRIDFGPSLCVNVFRNISVLIEMSNVYQRYFAVYLKGW